MMKKNIKKTMAIAMSTVFALSALAGCGQTEESKDSSQATGSAVNTESTASSESGAAEEDGIKWSGTISIAPYMYGPIENDVITPLIEEKLLEYGYDVELEHVYLENTQYLELLNLRLASDDAPDIFYIIDMDAYVQYCEQGLIATWDEEFFREHAPNVSAFIDAGEPDGMNAAFSEEYWQKARYEGKMACVPLYQDNSGALINMVYNKQWLDKLNAEVPETLDEFVELMYRFTNEDPDGNGVDDTYGFSTSVMNVIFGAYGAYPGFLHMNGEDYLHWYDVDGKLVGSDVMDGNEEALKLLKKLYDDGVIDPEFLTGENTGGYWALSHSFMNGRIGVTHTGRHTHYQPALYDEEGNQLSADGACLAEFKAIQGEDAEVVVGPWLEGPNGDVGGFLRSPINITSGGIYNASLNDDPEKLAAIFEILDLFSTDDELTMLALRGVEGEHYTYAEEGYILQNIDVVPDNASMNALGIMAYGGLYGKSMAYNYTYATVNNNSPSQKYQIELKSQYKNLANTVGYSSKVWAALPSAGDYRGELMTYRDETWLGMIQGTIDLDWDAFVEEWYKRGGQVLTDEANAWYLEHK